MLVYNIAEHNVVHIVHLVVRRETTTKDTMGRKSGWDAQIWAMKKNHIQCDNFKAIYYEFEWRRLHSMKSQ